MMTKLVVIVLILTLSMKCIRAIPAEHRLYQDIMRDVNPVVRPVENASMSVVVTLGAAVQMIIDMNERSQQITISMWMRFHWEALNLKWNPADYGDTKKLIVPLSTIWRPDVILYNNADEEYRGIIETDPILTHQGVVFWNAPATFTSACQIDTTYFPFDEQRCSLKFGSWSYDIAGIDLLNQSAGGDTSSFIDNSEWDLVGVPVRRHVIQYLCCPQPYPDVTFTVVIRRRPHFYMLNLMLPCLLTSFVTALNFLLPADSGEKVGLVLTVLLALTVFLLIVAETIPPSEATPLISKYFIITIFIVSLSAVFTVFVLSLHYQLPGVRPVPLWLRKLSFVYLAPLLLVGLPHDTGRAVVPPSVQDDGGRGAKRKAGRQVSGQLGRAASYLGLAGGEGNGAVSGELLRSLESIQRSLSVMTAHLTEQESDEDVLTQWKYVARVFDRLFLVTYVALVVTATSIIFGKYFIITIFIVSLSAVFTVFVLSLHYQLPGVRPVPLWLRKLSFVYLAPLLLVGLPHDTGRAVVPPSVQDDGGRGAKRKAGRQVSGQLGRAASYLGLAGGEGNGAVPGELLRCLESIQRSLSVMTAHLTEQESDEDVLTQWKYVARVFDRLFLVAYVALVVTATSIIFGQRSALMTGPPEQ